MNSLKDERDFGVCLYSGAGGNDPDLTVIKQSLRICIFTTITITSTTKTLEAILMVMMTAARCAGSCTRSTSCSPSPPTANLRWTASRWDLTNLSNIFVPIFHRLNSANNCGVYPYATNAFVLFETRKSNFYFQLPSACACFVREDFMLEFRFLRQKLES